ncbi:MAG: hypothetical protein ACHQ1H_01055 [Nitrososphaerales archaeon]
MKTKLWLFVALVVVILGQLTVLSSFFHSFETDGFLYGTSVVEISKMNYVYGWASITVSNPFGTSSPVIVQFANGTQIPVNSTYTFEMKFPRTGDCFCNGASGLFGTTVYVNESQPIVAAVLTNVSSSMVDAIRQSGSATPYNGLFDFYWFTIQGESSLTLNGYGVSY